MKNILPSLATKSTFALLALCLTRTAATAAFDPGSPSTQTPYDRYLAVPVRTVLSARSSASPSMEQVKKLMLLGRGFRYQMTTPYVPASPEKTAQTRAGDCKDKALWLCSQLGASEVRYVVGKTEPGIAMSHAWVMWRNEGRWWMLDCTLNSAPVLADELPQNRYIPLYSYSKDTSYRHAATGLNPVGDSRGKKASVASGAQR